MNRAIAIRPAAILAGGVFLLALATIPAVAQDCLEYGDYLHWHSSVPGDDHLGEGALLGDHLLMLDSFTGLLVYDVTDRRAPRRIATLPLTEPASSLIAAGQHAYVAVNSGLQVIDLADPAAPELAGHAATPSAGNWVRVLGDHAYMSAGTAVHVFDVSDPTDPEIVGTFDGGSTIRRLAVYPGCVYYSVNDHTFRMVDVTDPTDPQDGGSVYLGWVAFDLQIAGDRLMIAGWGSTDSHLATYSLTDPAMPQLQGILTFDEDAFASTAVGNRVYISAASRLLVFDIDYPTPPMPRGALPAPSYAHGVLALDDTVYLTRNWDGVQVIAATVPDSAPVLATAPTYYASVGIAAENDHVYLADYGVGIFDVADPLDPQPRGTWTSDWIHEVAVRDGLAYAAGQFTGVHVIDVSDPDAPLELGVAATPGNAWDLDLAGDHVYVADNVGGLQVVDVSIPTAPSLVGALALAGDARGVAVTGNLACIAADDAGLVLVDVTEPTTPAPITSLPLASEAVEIALAGSIAYVVVEGGGLVLVDIADPGSPQLLGSAQVSGIATDVMVIGAVAYVTGQDLGMQIVDVADPAAPFVTGSLDTGSAAFGSVIHGGHLFVAAWDEGLAVAWPHCPAVVPVMDQAPAPPARLAAPWPNPCNPRASIAFELAVPGRATVAVHGLDGRLVRLLADQRYGAGRHTVAWDGRDGAGRATASGVYVVRLASGGMIEARKLVLLR